MRSSSAETLFAGFAARLVLGEPVGVRVNNPSNRPRQRAHDEHRRAPSVGSPGTCRPVAGRSRAGGSPSRRLRRPGRAQWSRLTRWLPMTCIHHPGRHDGYPHVMFAAPSALTSARRRCHAVVGTVQCAALRATGRAVVNGERRAPCAVFFRHGRSPASSSRRRRGGVAAPARLIAPLQGPLPVPTQPVQLHPEAGSDAGAQRHERNRCADTDRETRRGIAVPRWWWRRRWWWRGWWRWRNWCHHTGVGRRIEYGSDTTFRSVAHDRRNHRHEGDRHARRCAGSYQTTNSAHDCRPPWDHPRPRLSVELTPRRHHCHQIGVCRNSGPSRRGGAPLSREVVQLAWPIPRGQRRAGTRGRAQLTRAGWAAGAARR